MEGRRQRSAKRARKAGEASTSSTQQLSTLERLHPDVLAEVLQRLGPMEAAGVRAVSRTIRKAIDGVAWRTLALRLASNSVQQVESVTEFVSRPSFAMAPEPELAVTIDSLQDQEPYASMWYRAVGSLFSACSASSGGLGGVHLTVSRCAVSASSSQSERLLSAALQPLCSAEEAGGSARTLKSISMGFISTCTSEVDIPHEIVRLLSSFPRLDHLELSSGYKLDSRATSALSAALPALLSAHIRLSDSAALAPFASHLALEELDIRLYERDSGSGGFQAFSMGPAARRLRVLDVCFGGTGFSIAELSSLGRLTSLEMLELVVELQGSRAYEWRPPRPPQRDHSFLIARVSNDPPFAANPHGSRCPEAIRSLPKLRELGLTLRLCQLDSGVLTELAAALSDLRARALVALRLEIAWQEPGAHAPVAALLRAAGPILVDFYTSDIRWESFAALAACPRLRRLSVRHPESALPYGAEQAGFPAAEAASVLAACPLLEYADGLSLGLSFDGEADAAAALEPLRRLAGACPRFAGAGCILVLIPGTSMCSRLKQWEPLAMSVCDRALSVFPEAETVPKLPFGFD